MAIANLVKKTGCTSVVLSQLRRTETMGIPTMQDLRESGQIENDAHLIVLLHRDYDSERGIFKDNRRLCGAQAQIRTPHKPEGSLRSRHSDLGRRSEECMRQSFKALGRNRTGENKTEAAHATGS